jgi:hypothetical protein
VQGRALPQAHMRLILGCDGISARLPTVRCQNAVEKLKEVDAKEVDAKEVDACPRIQEVDACPESREQI